jgi:hypothetical protein
MFPDEPLGSREKERRRVDVLSAIRTLYIYYKPEFWYWEVVEVFYRLVYVHMLYHLVDCIYYIFQNIADGTSHTY